MRPVLTRRVRRSSPPAISGSAAGKCRGRRRSCTRAPLSTASGPAPPNHRFREEASSSRTAKHSLWARRVRSMRKTPCGVSQSHIHPSPALRRFIPEGSWAGRRRDVQKVNASPPAHDPAFCILSRRTNLQQAGGARHSRRFGGRHPEVAPWPAGADDPSVPAAGLDLAEDACQFRQEVACARILDPVEGFPEQGALRCRRHGRAVRVLLAEAGERLRIVEVADLDPRA